MPTTKPHGITSTKPPLSYFLGSSHFPPNLPTKLHGVTSLIKRDGPKALTAIYGLLGLKYLRLEKDNAIDDCLENQSTPHDLYDDKHERRVEARVQALLEAAENPLERIRPCDIHKLTNPWKLRKA
jgi:hypothetical protein